MSITSSQVAAIGLSSQIGGGINSAIGSYYGASSQKSMLKAQAAIADTNARIAELGAQSALLQGQKQIGALTLQAGQLKSRQKAAMAANGIILGEGSAAEIEASTDIMAQIDANTLEVNSVMNAIGYRTQGVNYQNEALAQRATAKAMNPGMTAFSSLLGSAGSVASSWYSLNKSGALKGTIFEG